ncbi:bacterioferritin [Verticiella sediminum]|uniref:Bacterioferritin-associated ferredoxin n=1 Tax=Verticiella sediminum TaxID=1247510 RepID=A0A556A883_9BURK|nr:(2Fe-2S)-binding protein [Verticiella sediminum]TSH89104.1 bacterioferritin [Verticiella sediminum]
MYICICNGITEAELRESVAAGARSFEELQLETGVASCCGTCAGAAAALLPGGCPGPAACHSSAHAAQRQLARTPAPARMPMAPALSAPVRWISRVPRTAPSLAEAA